MCFYEKKHFASADPKKPTLSVPGKDPVTSLGERIKDYTGTFSEYNPVAIQHVYPLPDLIPCTLCLVVRKNITDPSFKKEFRLPAFKAYRSIGYHGKDFNNNGGISLSKEQMLQIAHAMDPTDTLEIMVPDRLSLHKFEEGIKIVTKI